MMRNPDIPREIGDIIAEHLDLPSALALAGTCRSLCAIGRTRVWKEVKLDLRTRRGGKRGEEEGQRRPSSAPKTGAGAEPGYNAIDDRITSLISLLDASPDLIPYITSLILPVPPLHASTSQAILALLSRVAPTLQSLDLVFDPFPRIPYGDFDPLTHALDTLLQDLGREVGEWPKLRRMRIPLMGEKATGLLVELLREMPRIRDLTVRPVNTKRPLPPTSSPPIPKAIGVEEAILALPSLRSLAIIPLQPFPQTSSLNVPTHLLTWAYGGLFARTVEVVDRIIPAAAGLTDFKLKSPHPWEGLGMDGILPKLPVEKLKGLEVEGMKLDEVVSESDGALPIKAV